MRRPGQVALALLLVGLTALAAAQAAVVDSSAGLVAALENGGTYQIAPGEYLLREPVVVRHDLELRGAGRDDVLIAAYGAPVAVWIEGDVDVYLEGLRLFYDADEGADLVVVSAARLALREVDLGFARRAEPSVPPMPGRENGHGSGVALIDGATLVGHDVRVAQNQLAGIEARSGARVELSDPTIVANYRGLVAVGSDVGIDVRGGSVSGHFAHGLVLDAQGLDASFHDVEFFDNGTVDREREVFWPAALIAGSASVTLNGGAMRDTPGVGIMISGAAQVGVRGMTFEAVGGQYEGIDMIWPALQVSGNARLTIEESALVGNTAGAVHVDEGGALAMRRVRVEGNGGWAHTSVDGSATLIVHESTFAGNEGTVFAGGRSTLGMTASQLTGSAGFGLVVAFESAVSVTNSLIADNAEDGVRVDGASALEMQTTLVRGNRSGVFVSGEARATLVENEFVENLGAGIILTEGARADLRGNTITGSPVGVHLADASLVLGSENVFAEVGEQVRDAR